MYLYIWAILATIVSLTIFYAWVGNWRLKNIKVWYIYLIITFPFSILVNLSIKKQIGIAMISLFNLSETPKLWPLWFLALANLIAPLTEEAIKLLPTIFSEVRKSLQDKTKAFVFGLLLGTGFGIGEIWYLAYAFNLSKPELATVPFFHLIGFFNERVGSTIIHGALTAIVLFGYNKNLIKYYFIAVAFHYLVNIGPALYQKGLTSLATTTIPLFISVITLFSYLFKIERQLRKESSIPRIKEILWSKDRG
ncbi:MAG: hypothetical protein ACUVQ3_09400 [bacterium]